MILDMTIPTHMKLASDILKIPRQVAVVEFIGPSPLLVMNKDNSVSLIGNGNSDTVFLGQLTSWGQDYLTYLMRDAFIKHKKVKLPYVRR